MLWETGASQGRGSMMCKVKWFYHPEEIETCGRKFDLKLPVRPIHKLKIPLFSLREGLKKSDFYHFGL